MQPSLWLNLPVNIRSLSFSTQSPQSYSCAHHCITAFEKNIARSLTTSSALLSAIVDPRSQVQHQIRLGMHLEEVLSNQHTSPLRTYRPQSCSTIPESEYHMVVGDDANVHKYAVSALHGFQGDTFSLLPYYPSSQAQKPCFRLYYLPRHQTSKHESFHILRSFQEAAAHPLKADSLHYCTARIESASQHTTRTLNAKNNSPRSAFRYQSTESRLLRDKSWGYLCRCCMHARSASTCLCIRPQLRTAQPKYSALFATTGQHSGGKCCSLHVVLSLKLPSPSTISAVFSRWL